MGEPITPGLGARIVDILESRAERETKIEMADGQTYVVFNICWGRDMGEDWEHITTNISPDIKGASLDFFLTSGVTKLTDPHTGAVLWQSSGS